MNRSLLGFMAFCCVLLVGGMLLVWYLGPTVAGILVDTERRDAPYFVLTLVPGESSVQTEAVTRVRQGVMTAVSADGGRLLWSAGGAAPVQARAGHDSYRGAFAALDLYGFERGGALVQMLTGEEFRAVADASTAASVMLLGTKRPLAVIPPPTAAVVAVFYELTVDPGSDPLETDAARWLAALDAHGGQRFWHTPIDWIRGRERWNRLVLLAFPDTAHAIAWLRDPLTQSGRVLASRYVDDQLIVLARPGHERWK